MIPKKLGGEMAQMKYATLIRAQGYKMRYVRMTQCRIVLAVLFFTVILIFWGCRKGHEESKQSTAPPKPHVSELSGQIFVVTKARENVKLALVTISAIPEATLQAHLAKRKASGEEEIRQLQIGGIQKECEKPAAKLKLAQQNEEMVRSWRAEAHERLKNSLGANEVDSQSVGLDLDSFTKADLSLQTAKAKLMIAQREYSACVERLKTKERYFRSSAFIFQQLPAGVAETKSDVDGKFHLTLPVGTPYCIAAHATRQTVSSTEEYFWLVRVVLAESKNEILLANDNMTTSGAKDSLVALLN